MRQVPFTTLILPGSPPFGNIHEWEENWELLQEKVNDLLPEDLDDEDGFGPKELRECLNKDANWSDDDIWKALIDDCAQRIAQHQGRIEALEHEREKNRQRIEILRVLGNVPSRDELDRLLRYEGAIERQFYQALNQLERLQRLRAGDHVPAPIQVDAGTAITCPGRAAMSPGMVFCLYGSLQGPGSADGEAQGADKPLDLSRSADPQGTAATRKFQEEKLRVETEKFRVGKSMSLLVAQAQRDLVASQIAEVRALANYLKPLVALYRLEGSLLPRRGLAAPGADPVPLDERAIGN